MSIVYERLWGVGSPERLLHVYGPTEATTFSSWHWIRRDRGGSQQYSYRKTDREHAGLCARRGDESSREGNGRRTVPGGAGMARGYWRRARMTAERFVANPYGEAGSRIYRTGDRARYRRDGRLEYGGRLDHQVKLRGYRIELGEVETAIREYGGWRECVVVVRGEQEQQQLVAYVVGEGKVDGAWLRKKLQGHLPEYMVPGVVVQLEKLPQTPNGKVDRRGLPEPESGERREQEQYIAPETRMEVGLAEIWGEILKVEEVGVRDNFFELGGHSLLATQVVARVRERMGVEMPLRVLFDAAGTLGEIARRLEEQQRGEEGVGGAGVKVKGLPPLRRQERGNVVPLSYMQERLWFLEQLESLHGAYNESLGLRLKGKVEVGVLERALGEMVRRHETLRTRIETTEEGKGVQVIEGVGNFGLEVVELLGMEGEEREERAREIAREEGVKEFELAQGLFRVKLLRLEEEEHWLLVTIHHIVSDYWSHLVFMRELATLYGAYVEGRRSPLAELEVQYADYTLWQREWLAGERLEEQLRYWKERLAGVATALELPADRVRPAVPSYRGARQNFVITEEVSRGLQNLARQEHVTLYMVLLGAFQVLLARWSGQSDIVVGSPIAGRTDRQSGSADRVLCEHAGDEDGCIGEPDVPGIAGAGEAGDGRGIRAPGSAVREAGGRVGHATRCVEPGRCSR